ncbi:MAG: glycosyltransferase [Planctomycetota bacterium]|jgi:GT2 family glycosyltransferase
MSDQSSIDILMVTHDRPDYTRLALGALLDSCDDAMRVWVWHNGNDSETLEVVRFMSDHERFHRLHHSPENRLIREPINWLFEHAEGDLLSLVNDDCVVSDGWARTLSRVHDDIPELGVAACWHFQEEDFIPELADSKTLEFSGGHRLMVNPWVQGSGVMVKRECIQEIGGLTAGEQGFTPWCIRLAVVGWVNGWCVPLVPIDHMDDPRSPNTQLQDDDDLRAGLPLSARHRGTETIDEWTAHLRRSALIIQQAPADPYLYVGWRKKLRRGWSRLRGQEVMY